MLLKKTMRKTRHSTGNGGRCPRMPDHKDSSCLASCANPLSTNLHSSDIVMERFSGSTARNAVIAKYASPFTYHSVGNHCCHGLLHLARIQGLPLCQRPTLRMSFLHKLLRVEGLFQSSWLAGSEEMNLSQSGTRAAVCSSFIH